MNYSPLGLQASAALKFRFPISQMKFGFIFVLNATNHNQLKHDLSDHTKNVNFLFNYGVPNIILSQR